jgi:tRNA A-37 threonylcarbamoyl transferase component Bud32
MLPSKQKILPEEYQALVQSCQIIEKDAYGEKVLRSNDGIFIKIFRRKRLLSSALVYPYAHRFIHNAKNLSTLGIPTVRVIKCAHCSNPARDIVWYEPIQGITLREFCRQENPASLMRSFGEFIAHIHETGILFRSLHWGNIIVQPDSSFGLIDIADMSFKKRPLNTLQRQRNFYHLLRREYDQEKLMLHIEPFCSGYATRSDIYTHICRKWVEAALHSQQSGHIGMKKVTAIPFYAAVLRAGAFLNLKKR